MSSGSRIRASARGCQRGALVVLLTALLTACGGGGGGDGNGAGADGGGNSSVPPTPPAAPEISYSGNSSTAVLDDDSVPALADGIYFGVFLGLQLADESARIVLPPSGVIDDDFAGPEGGTARVTGRIDTDGTGWIRYDFSAYAEDDAIWTGTEVFERLQPNDGAQDSLTEISLHELNVRTRGQNTTLNGTITHRSAIAPEQSTVAGTVHFRDNVRARQLLAEDIALERTGSRPFDITGAGRIYHEVHGWIDFEFESPWVFEAEAQVPNHGGPVIGRTGAGGLMRIVAPAEEIVSLQFTSEPSAAVDRAARLRWDTLFEVQVQSPGALAPAADAGASLYAPPGTEVVLNGALSSHPRAAFLDFRWELVFRPPGSEAEIDSRDAVRPRIVLDAVGRYLFRLEVNDGARTAEDLVVLTADPEMTYPTEPLEAQLPPDRTAGLGENVIVDKTLYAPRALDAFNPIQIQVNAPDGDTAAVSQDAETATFLADQTGTYVVVMHEGSSSLFGNRPRDFQAVRVDSREPFAPAVSFPAPATPGDLALADLDGDGRDDLVIAGAVDGAGRIDVYFSSSLGFVGEPTTVASGSSESIAVGDVSGDGLADIVIVVLNGIEVFVQRSDGTFAGPTPLLTDCFVGEDRPVLIADMDHDGRNDVVAIGACSATPTVEVYHQQDDGTLAAPQSTAIADFDSTIAVGDLNGDAVSDLAVGAEDDASGQGNFAIYYGAASGTFAAGEYLEFSFFADSRPGLAIADLDNDGREDLAIAPADSAGRAFSAHVYLQTESGTLSRSATAGLGSGIRDLALVDLDHDGLLDIIPSAGPYGLKVSYQQPDGSFASIDRTALYFEDAVTAWPRGLGDVNGDGHVDLAFWKSVGRTPHVVLLLARQ